jgi:serine-type D-Ala-D-Ala carboxypeptidase (penicillin-binding protein 5/6)
MKHKKYHYKATKTPGLKSKRSLAIVLFSITACLGLFTYIRFNASETIQQEVAAVETMQEPKYKLDAIQPPLEGQFAIAALSDGIDMVTDDEKVTPIASLTKLITALVVLEKAPLNPNERGDIIILTANDEQYYWDYIALQGTVTSVTAGQQISQYEALQTMLLASSNNMSDTIIDYYFESREDYLNYANSMISRLGLTNTKVADTTGFSPNSVSTPSDMLLLGKIILENPVLAEIVAQKDATVSVAGAIPNYNALIDLPYVTGLKPGLTDEAGYCLLFSMDIPNSDGEIVTAIGVVLGMRDTQMYRSFILSAYNQTIETIQKTPL